VKKFNFLKIEILGEDYPLYMSSEEMFLNLKEKDVQKAYMKMKKMDKEIFEIKYFINALKEVMKEIKYC